MAMVTVFGSLKRLAALSTVWRVSAAVLAARSSIIGAVTLLVTASSTVETTQMRKRDTVGIKIAFHSFCF